MFHAKLVSLWNLYSGNSKVKFELYKHCNTLNCAVLCGVYPFAEGFFVLYFLFQHFCNPIIFQFIEY